jgi:hypothetical protein
MVSCGVSSLSLSLSRARAEIPRACPRQCLPDHAAASIIIAARRTSASRCSSGVNDMVVQQKPGRGEVLDV